MSSLERYEYSAPSMGTVLKIAVYSPSEQRALDAIDAGLTEIDRLIPILNNYDPDSEISRLVTHGRDPVPLSPDLGAVLKHAQRWYELSQGAFDITIGPLTRIWSQARRERALPSDESIDSARSRSGWRHVRWLNASSSNQGALSVSLLFDAMRIDASGIATGYIIDRAFDAIRKSGIESLLIDVGGDIRVGQSPPGSKGWKIDIAGLGKDSPLLTQRQLEHCAITTSGDLNQFVEIEGVRYSHLIDPATGSPVPRRQSATAIAPLAIDADAGATALCVLGMDRASKMFGLLPLQEGILLEASLEAESNPLARYRHLTQDADTP